MYVWFWFLARKMGYDLQLVSATDATLATLISVKAGVATSGKSASIRSLRRGVPACDRQIC